MDKLYFYECGSHWNLMPLLLKVLTFFCVELWNIYLLRWMLWGLLNRCYFLPVHTKYGLHSVRLCSLWCWGRKGQPVQLKTEPEASELVLVSLLHWSDAAAGNFGTGVGGSRTWACPVPLDNGGLLSSHFSPQLCFPSDLLAKWCFSNRNWVAKCCRRNRSDQHC